MKLFEKLLKLNDIVIDDRDNGIPPGRIGRDLSDAAVAAITGGIKSDDWKKYMSLFADNKEQLERLTIQKPVGEEPAYLKLFRAYIVSNAVCDITTTTNTAARIDGRLDAGLNDAVDEQFVRLLDIPGLDGLNDQ